MSRTGPTNVLFETGEHGDCDEAACMDLLGVDDPTNVDVLFVTVTKSGRERIETLKRHADAPPSNVGIVTVDVGGSDGSARLGGESGPMVRRISDPSDLTGVGIAISEFLSAWHGNGNRTVVCFESVTALLQYVEANRVFQFLNEITSKFEQSGARAHFHITPAAHEGQVLSVLTSLFDDRVTARDLGHVPEEESTGGTTAATTGAAVDDASTEAADDESESTPEDSGAPETDPDDADEKTGFVFAGADAESDADAPEDGAETAPTTDPETPATETSESDGSESGNDPSDSEVADDPVDSEVDDDPVDSGSASTDETVTDSEASASDTTPPDSDPADIVWSVINGEIDDPDADESDASPFDFPAETTGGDSDAGNDDTEVQGADAEDEANGTDTEDTTADDTGGEAPTTANFGRQKRRSKRDPIERPQVQRPTEPPEDDSEYKSAVFSRTTATVIGVVVMVALVSFLTAAVPMPAGTPISDAEPEGTPTPVPATGTGANGTQAQATPSPTTTVTPEPTATPTATATPEPTATPTPTSSGGSTGDSTDGTDGGDTTATPEPTATATPDSTPEPTATPTPDGSLTGAIDDTTDSTTDAIDNTTDSLVGDDGLL